MICSAIFPLIFPISFSFFYTLFLCPFFSSLSYTLFFTLSLFYVCLTHPDTVFFSLRSFSRRKNKKTNKRGKQLLFITFYLHGVSIWVFPMNSLIWNETTARLLLCYCNRRRRRKKIHQHQCYKLFMNLKKWKHNSIIISFVCIWMNREREKQRERSDNIQTK